MTQHRTALTVIAVTLALDALAAVAYAHLAHIPVLPPAHGLASGLDWAVATMTTTGDSSVIPVTRAEHWLSLAVHLSVIPLGAASISFFTSSLTSVHIRREGARTRQHVTDTHTCAPSPGSDTPADQV